MSPTPLTAADYCDWCNQAGLYLHNVSHADRYRTYQGKISRAGLAIKIVHDLLESTKGGFDLQAWRNGDVYEAGPDLVYRIDQTAAALDEIGAKRAAAKVGNLKNTSTIGGFMDTGDYKGMMEAMKNVNVAKVMEEFRANVARAMPDMAAQAGLPMPPQHPVAPDPEIESWEQVEHLLQSYMHANEASLSADIATHGDPRSQPGFTPEKRQAELDHLRRREIDREAQADDVKALNELMNKIDRQVAKNPRLKPGKVAKDRREFLRLYRHHAGRPADELLPDTQKCLQKADSFQKKHAMLFTPKPIDDAALLKRLEAIGKYAVDMGSKQVQVSWDTLAGLICDWTEFSLSIKYPIGDAKSLTTFLGAYDRMKAQFAKHAADLRREVLQSFDIHREFLERFGYDDYELGADGKPTEASILKHAGSGSIHISDGDYGEFGESADERDAVARVYFAVDWDDEHGLELFLDVEPEPAPAPQTPSAGAFTVPSHLTFSEAGPTLTEANLAAFEKKHDVKLPADYRAFLLVQNGGEPTPNHLKVKFQGGPGTPTYVEHLYAVEAPGQNLEVGLGDALELHRAEDKPENYLPIGRVRVSDPGASTARSELLIALKGKKACKILLAMPMTPSLMGGPGFGDSEMMAAMYEQFLSPVAPSFGEFLAKLSPSPTQTIPAWLETIRAGAAAAFLNWLQAKGKLQEEYVGYGESRRLTALDYLALEAPPEMLKELVSQKAVHPNQLRASWRKWNPTLARFRQLLTALGKNQLHFAFLAADVWDDVDFLNELLAAKVNLNIAIDEEGATPLHFAIRNRRPEAARWLLEHGASPNKADDFGRTALVWAESERDLESMKLLLEVGEKIESLFPHMPTLADKLRLIKSRWFGQFEALAEYLRGRGVEVKVP